MRSFGLYYKRENSQTSSLEGVPIPKKGIQESTVSESELVSKGIDIIEVHCNLWKVLEKKSLVKSLIKEARYKYFLDFGLMFHPAIKEIGLHLPFEFSEKDLCDLGEKLNDQELCSLIFNENAQTTRSERNFHLIKFKTKTLLGYPISNQNWKFEPTKEIASDAKEHTGTNVFISIKSDPQDVIKDFTADNTPSNIKIYIRFRLTLSEKELKNICKQEYLSTDIIQSIFSKNEMFDFRINDDREINRKLDEDLRSRSYYPFRMNKVHFLFMADIRNPIVTASANYKTRFLETEKWKEYVGVPIPECMLAYHWKDRKEKTLKLISELPVQEECEEAVLKQVIIPESKINYLFYDKESSFSAFKLFFMLTYPHRNWKQVWFYALIVVFMGWIGSVLSWFITNSQDSSIVWRNLFGIGFLVVGIICLYWAVLKKDSRVTFP